MHTIRFSLCVKNITGLARVALIYFHNADTFQPGFVPEHVNDPVKWPFMELLIPSVSPAFETPDAMKVPHGDRGDVASLCIVDYSYGISCERWECWRDRFWLRGYFSGIAPVVLAISLSKYRSNEINGSFATNWKMHATEGKSNSHSHPYVVVNPGELSTYWKHGIPAFIVDDDS